MKILYLKQGLTAHVNFSGDRHEILTGNLHGFDILDESLEKLETFNGCFKDFLTGDGKGAVCAAIGFFDGVHLGHQEVIKSMKKDAEQYGAISVVITFDRHPLCVITPSEAPLLITTPPHKIKLIKDLGISYTILLPFNSELSRLPAEDFVKCLSYELGAIKTISVGENFLFGHNRSGDVELLKTLGGKLGFVAHGIKSVAIGRKRISSTRIRESIQKGDLARASQMLGRNYSIFSNVIRGNGLGKTIGFPTANINVNGLVLPPCGVYAARVINKSGKFNAILNLGYKPTISSQNQQITCEVHILNFDADLYSTRVEVEFVEKIRDEKKFSSLDELKHQIQKDILTAKRIFEKGK